MNYFMNVAETLIKGELILVAVLIGLNIFIWSFYGICVLLSKLLEQKEDDPMDMFMGGRPLSECEAEKRDKKRLARQTK